MVLINGVTNMVRLPGCYDVHWSIYCDWLWAFWDGEQVERLSEAGPRTCIAWGEI